MDVSAVIVSWNGLALLPRCLDALRSQTHPALEVVVVDNGSTDGSLEWLRSRPEVTLLENPVNVGFAAANNQGIRASSGTAVLLLNTDVFLDQGYLEAAVRVLLARERAGSVTGRLRRSDGRLDSTGHVVFDVGWAQNRGEELPDIGFEEPEEVFGVSAAAALYRRSALDAAAVSGQYFDESYFAYVEDVDLDWRLRWMGWQAWYEPSATAVHLRSASGARQSAAIMRHILKNRLLTVVKNHLGPRCWLHLPGVALFTVAKAIDFGRAHPSAVLGLLDGARLFPAALRARRGLEARAVAEYDSVYYWLQPFPWRTKFTGRMPGGRSSGDPGSDVQDQVGGAG